MGQNRCYTYDILFFSISCISLSVIICFVFMLSFLSSIHQIFFFKNSHFINNSKTNYCSPLFASSPYTLFIFFEYIKMVWNKISFCTDKKKYISSYSKSYKVKIYARVFRPKKFSVQTWICALKIFISNKQICEIRFNILFLLEMFVREPQFSNLPKTK